MTRTRPCRRITLHFSHIFLTDGRTFMASRLLLDRSWCRRGSLVPVGDAAATQVVWSELHLDAITRQDPDVVHSHLPRDVGEHLVPVLELDAEHGVGQRLDHRPLYQDRVVLGLCQGRSPPTTSDAPGRAERSLGISRRRDAARERPDLHRRTSAGGVTGRWAERPGYTNAPTGGNRTILDDPGAPEGSRRTP